MNLPDDILTSAEAAWALRIPRESLRYLVRSGHIRSTRLGDARNSRILIHREDLAEYQNSLARLPDSPPAHLRADGSIRRRIDPKTGRIYLAVSAWTTEDDAQTSADEIRSQGCNASVTKEIRPLRAYLPGAAPRGWRRSPANRYIWLVWSGVPRAGEEAAA